MDAGSVNTTADVVVIGAGIVGSSAALELARRGLDVLVVDKAGGAGMGSTSAAPPDSSAGFTRLPRSLT